MQELGGCLASGYITLQTLQRWAGQHQHGTGPGAVQLPSLQAGLLRGSVAAADQRVERGGAGDCEDSGTVPEAGELPWRTWTGPG